MRSTLYAKELKRVDEWHVAKQFSRVRDELSQKNIKEIVYVEIN